MRGLNQRQARLFFALNTAVLRHEPADFQPVIDEDVAEAAGAMAATLETRSRGVIYDHRPASLPAERLMAALRPVVADSGRTGGSAFEREAAVVLRQLEKAVHEVRSDGASNKRAYLELVGRVLEKASEEHAEEINTSDGPRLILP